MCVVEFSGSAIDGLAFGFHKKLVRSISLLLVGVLPISPCITKGVFLMGEVNLLGLIIFHVQVPTFVIAQRVLPLTVP
jgi:hypothetical protein